MSKPNLFYVWIYNRNLKTFKKFKVDDPRLDWNWKWTPENEVKYWDRRPTGVQPDGVTPAGGRSSYYYWGETAQEAADRYNEYALKQIQELEAEICKVKQELIKP